MGLYQLLFPREYVAACDLEGKDKDVTISHIQVKELKTDSGPKKKPVMFFKDAKKKMILNITNARIIADMYGDDTDSWQGQTITLYPTTCEAFGKMVDCIRVRDGIKRAIK